jgi:hypothetical protein
MNKIKFFALAYLLLLVAVASAQTKPYVDKKIRSEANGLTYYRKVPIDTVYYIRTKDSEFWRINGHGCDTTIVYKLEDSHYKQWKKDTVNYIRMKNGVPY